MARFRERWLVAVGALFAAFGVVMAIFGDTAPFRIVFGPLIDRALRLGVLAAVTLWFVVDTGASIACGVWGNALAVNLPAFLALAVPLALGARDGGDVGK